MAGGGWGRPEALGWLESSQHFGIKLGLENTRRLFAAVGDPQSGLKFIHVAGTNGKGSVCAMLDAIFREAGLRAGLYTSPHLVDFSERIRVNGEKIPDAALIDGLARLREAARGWPHPPTFFELTTVLAAMHFANEGCEVVVWETGMGGRLDATNVVDPVVSVITPIGMDHQRWLGNSIAAIAAEKAGILKPGRPAVCAGQCPEAEEVLRGTAAGKGVPFEIVDSEWPGPVGLAGPHQRRNAALAARAAEISGFQVSVGAVERGLSGVKWPGRFQITADGWVLDGAHNPHAMEHLAAAWREKFGARKAAVLFSCLADKDARGMAQILEPMARECHVVEVGGVRGAPSAALAAAWNIPVTRHGGVREAVEHMRKVPGPVLVTGSLYLVGEVLAALGLSP